MAAAGMHGSKTMQYITLRQSLLAGLVFIVSRAVGVNHVVRGDYCFQGGDEAGEADDEAEEVEIQNREFSVLNSFTY